MRAVDLKEEKKAWRKACKAQIDKLSREEVTVKSRRINERALQMVKALEKKAIGVYSSIGKEVATVDLIKALLISGYRVGLPVIPQASSLFREGKEQKSFAYMSDQHKPDEDKSDENKPADVRSYDHKSDDNKPDENKPDARHMEFRLVRTMESLVRGAYGILEPQDGRLIRPEDLEVLFIPGLAFTRSGQRLGRGGGYYDRYLSRLRPETLKVGLAFSDQIMPWIPVEHHDLKLDLIITEDEVIYPE